MRIVTAANSDYIDYLVRQVGACKKHLGIAPDVYDIGLRPNHRFLLKTLGCVTSHTVALDMPLPGANYPGNYYPKALFKPRVLREYCAWHKDEDVLYLDADAYPVGGFEFPCEGIGVTPVSEEKMSKHEGEPIYEYIGPYHSGVLFLGAYKGRDDFLDAWQDDMRGDRLPSDKKSLNHVLRYEDVTVLDTEVWNSPLPTSRAKIAHDQWRKIKR